MAGKKKKKGGRPTAPSSAPEPEAREAAPPEPQTPSPGSASPAPAGQGDATSGSRRRFIKLVGAGALAAGAAGIWITRQNSGRDHDDGPDAGEPDGGHAPGPAPRPASLVTFDEHEYDTLDALAGVLLPADAEDPGARETGAMIYIDRAMATPAFAVGARGMKVAVKAFDWQSKHAYDKKFVELSVEEQQAVTQAVYQGEADKGRFKGRVFMTLMMSMTLEGHLSEPSYGGNRDEMGWKLVAFQPMDPRPGHPTGPGGHHGHGGHGKGS